MSMISSPGDNFLGHPINYWLELERKTLQSGTTDLLQEIADLRSKVSFYESRIKQMKEFMER